VGFGKRPATATAAPPNPHGRAKVFPDALWQSETGGLLRDLGMSPNDESNLVPNAASIDSRIRSGQAALETRTLNALVKARARFPDAALKPFFLIPDPCWNGPHGTFLMRSLDLYPFDDWNVMFLAADDATAEALEIAAHPNGNVPAFVEAADKLLGQVSVAMDRAHAEAGVTHDFAGYQEFREDVRLKVKGLAMAFGRVVVETWERHAT